MADLVGDMGDPVKVAAAFKPVIEGAVDRLLAGLPKSTENALDGLMITITFAKKIP